MLEVPQRGLGGNEGLRRDPERPRAILRQLEGKRRSVPESPPLAPVKANGGLLCAMRAKGRFLRLQGTVQGG